VTVSWLAKLEQGHAHAVSHDVLDALARALGLDDVERAHLFALAGYRVDGSGGDGGRATPALLALLDQLEPNPAYLLDRCWNIVAWNEAESRLFPPLADRQDSAPNLLELVFLDDDLNHLMADHDAEQARLVSQFRSHCAEWPNDARITALVDRLRRSSPTFAGLWDALDVAPFVSTRRVFAHPRAGHLELDHHRLSVLDQPGMQLVVYTSAPGTDGVERLQES
jgi:hypothetical protein